MKDATQPNHVSLNTMIGEHSRTILGRSHLGNRQGRLIACAPRRALGWRLEVHGLTAVARSCAITVHGFFWRIPRRRSRIHVG